MIFIKLAWRNLFRNRRRTLLSGLMIGFGLAALMATDAFVRGAVDNMVQSATSTFLGDAQIHKDGFRKTHEVEQFMTGSASIAGNLRKEPLVKNASERVVSFAMLTSPANVNSIMMYGIDPASERGISKIDEAIVQGEYFKTGEKGKILIGKKLADLLEVTLGDKVVVTVAQAKTGELSQEMFRIGGIFSLGIREMDSAMAFVPIANAREMLKIGESAHEIAFTFKELRKASDAALPLWAQYSKDGNEALSWVKLMPELNSFIAMSDFSLYIMAIILFGIVGIGIINTLFMSLYERMFEFGVMRAVGTRPVRMASLVVLEAASLALISVVIGIIIGTVILGVVSYTGIDYTGSEFMNVTINNMIYPVITLRQYTLYPVCLIFAVCLVGLYPAVYAAKITPAKALRQGN